MEQKKIKCELSVEEAQLVLTALAELPLKVSLSTFSSLKYQFDAQIRKSPDKTPNKTPDKTLDKTPKKK